LACKAVALRVQECHDPFRGMKNSCCESVVIFALDELQFALGIDVIDRVTRAVAITPLPDAPPGVLGVVNVQGDIVPVYDMRVRFGLPRRELRSSDFMVLAHTSNRRVAVLVDSAKDMVSLGDAARAPADELVRECRSLQGILINGQEVVMVEDLEGFLSAEDHIVLEKALSQ
jgi:purine-binding chemotaxis protein CheW